METEGEESLLGSSLSWSSSSLCTSPCPCFPFTQSSWEEEEKEEEDAGDDMGDAVFVKRLESSAISVACYESWREQLSVSPRQNLRQQDDGEVGLDKFWELDVAGHVSFDVIIEDCVPTVKFRAGDSVYSANCVPSTNSLATCSLCRNLLLQGRDIYMYRGDCAFCSEECRYRQIALDEMNDQCSSAAAYCSVFF